MCTENTRLRFTKFLMVSVTVTLSKTGVIALFFVDPGCERKGELLLQCPALIAD